MKCLTAHKIGMVMAPSGSMQDKRAPEIMFDEKPPMNTAPELKLPNSTYYEG